MIQSTNSQEKATLNTKKPLSVLLVDDDEDDYFLTTDILRDIPSQRFEITWASNYDDALTQLSENHFDICFFDYILGARTGLDLLRIAHDLRVETPIILLTGKGDVTIDTQAMRMGVTDYLVKGDLEPINLERSIRYAIERTASLKAIRQSEEKYRGLFEGSMDVIYLLDADGYFRDVNDSATQLLGYTKAEFIGKKITDLFETDTDKVRFAAHLAEKESVRDFETNLMAANGDPKHCIIACTCHRVPSSKTEELFFQCIVHDITRRKKAEEELLIAEKLAATALFVRMLGHEIRNPLNNINLAISQIEPENFNKEDQDFLDIIHRNSLRIGQLLTDLLQASNPGQINFQACQPDELLDQTLALAADRIALKNIRVEKTYAEALLPIQADPEKLRIALLNLIINAVEIVPAGTGALFIGLQSDPSGCRIYIRDNGPGIPREHLSKIFDPYFSRKPNGLGLGLASTRSIVQQHGGRIELRSEPGRGAEFTVHLNNG